MKNISCVLLVLIAFTGSATAQYSLPQPLVGGTRMSLFGIGEYADLGEDIYMGALYIPQLESNIRAGSSKRMEMRIVADSLSARRFTQLWLDAITLCSSKEERGLQSSQIQKFSKMLKGTLQRGDQVAFEYLASVGQTVVMINQIEVGVIYGVGFFDILLGAWVGDMPSSSELKAGILGQIEAEEQLLIKRRFSEIAGIASRR
ncbi:MAG: chalcone isomerase family protein [Pseudomonadota bacterium]